MRKFFVLLLGLLLITGGLGLAAAAAEADLMTDIYGETTLRATVNPFYVELPWAKKKWGGSGTATYGISGINMGAKGPSPTPFYGLLQLNLERDTDSLDYNFSTFESGIGAQLQVFENVSIFGEITAADISLDQLNDTKPVFTAGMRWDFALWPTAQSGET